jgi:SAM-dependent methyltransferase
MEAAAAEAVATMRPALTDNERWYLALTARWARRLARGEAAGVAHAAGPDVDFAERVLGLWPGMRVLDLACGWGRTSLELARRGYVVSALDLSPDLLALGRSQAEAQGVSVEFVEGTARNLPDLGRFDAVCAFYDDCLVSYADEADNRAAIARISRALRPGGRLLFGTTDCAPLLPAVQRSVRTEDGETVEETISFDAASRTGTSERLHRLLDGRRERYRRVRRHYTLAEVAELLAESGLLSQGAWNAYDAALPFGSRPEGMVVAALKRGDGDD